MVLEGLINIKNARRKPFKIFALGLLYSTAAIILAIWIFPSSPSLLAVFFTTMASIPLMVNLLRSEELRDEKSFKTKVGKRHHDVFLIFLFLFLGFLASFSIWFIALPSEISQKLFSEQLYAIRAINTKVSGGFVADEILGIILINNIKVLGFCILFSLIYGSGAIFILTWNASVISAAIGTTIRNGLGKIAQLSHFDIMAVYFKTIPLGFARYMTHGIFEISAYFLGGIAGGIISAAIVRHKWNSPEFSEVISDALHLIINACLILVLAAIIEITISPLIRV